MPIPKPNDPRFLAAFTIYAILIGIFSSTTVALIQICGRRWFWALWVASLVAILVVWRIYDPQIRAWFAERKRITELCISTQRQVRPAAGLMLLVGRDRSYVYAMSAVDYHLQTLRYLWLIHSADETSRYGAEEIGSYASQRCPAITVFKRLVQDLFSVEEAKSTVEVIRKQATGFGLSSTDFICDFTGMSKPVSAGVVLACIRPEHRLQYMEPNGFLPDGRPDPKAGAKPVEVDVNYDVELV